MQERTPTHLLAPNAPAAIDAAWASVRFILGVILGLFGPPSEVLALRLVPRRWRAEMAAWLRPAETLVRYLLGLRAASLLVQVELGKSSKARARGQATRPAVPRGEPGEDSARWRGVCFVIVPPPPPRFYRPPAPRGSRRPTPFTARALAERIEALIRVTQNPEHAALRLARRLARRPSHELPKMVRVFRPYADDPSNPARTALQSLTPYANDVLGYLSSA